MTAEPLYDQLADLLVYPRPDLRARAEQCRDALAAHDPQAATALAGFLAAISTRQPSELEERYAQSFDMRPDRCLDLGYQIFGETYKRGVFLVKMKSAIDAHRLDPGVELADHLPIVLRLLARLGPEEGPRDLCAEVVLPVIEKVLRTFDDEGDGYRSLLEAVKQTLMHDHRIERISSLPGPTPPPSGDDARRLPMFPGFEPPSERHPS